MIEVVPAAPPPRRPRVQNPAVDNVIHSGEIEVPRSLIVKSSSQPALQREEDHTEPLQRLPPVAARPTAPPVRKFGRIAFLVAALAPAIAAIVLRSAAPAKQGPAPKAVEAESVAQLLATTFDGEAHAAQLRAEAIASSSMLRAGIQTDAATLADMAKDQDVVFALGKGEHLQVFQASDHGNVPLLSVPAHAPGVTPSEPNTARLELDGGNVVVVVTTPVTKPGGGTAGVLALAAPIDLAAAKARTYDQLSGVALTGFAQPIALGGGAAAAGGTPVKVPVAPTLAKGPALAVTATLAAAAPLTEDHVNVYARNVCAALATLFLLLYLGSVVLRR